MRHHAVVTGAPDTWTYKITPRTLYTLGGAYGSKGITDQTPHLTSSMKIADTL